MKKRTTKYNNKKVEYGGYTFDSEAEKLFYQYLEKEQAKGRIRKIEVQPTYELIPKFKYQGKTRRAMTYTADFKTTDNKGNQTVYDVKGMETQQGNMRRKLFEYFYNEIPLVWVSRSLKFGDKNGWIDTDELKKKRATNRRKKKMEAKK